MSNSPQNKLTRKYIEENTIGFYRTAEGTRPDLRVVNYEGRKIIVKDFKGSDFLFRAIVGPILIRREFGALRKLIGIHGIPQLICKIDKYAIAMEHISGQSLDRVQKGILDNNFYINLRRLVDDMHRCGVAHCDLRSRGNVMYGDDGLPYIVDFAACVYRGRGLNPFIRFLFEQFVKADENAVLRIKRRLSPELLSDEDNAELNTPLPFERPAVLIGENIRKITRKLLARRTYSNK